MRQIDTEATRRLHERANSGPARHWLTKLSVAPVSANSVRVVAPDSYYAGECENRYGPLIARTLREYTPEIRAVKYIVDANVTTPTPAARPLEADAPKAAGAGAADPTSGSRGEGGSMTDAALLVPASTIRPERVEWLWRGWLALGKFHVLGGAAGCGKTTLATDLAATLSVGATWPDGSEAPIGETAIWTGEDDLGDTLVPRLAAAGADRRKILFVGARGRRPFDPAQDMGALADAIGARAGAVKLLIVDPIVAVAAPGARHDNAENRRSLAPLVDLAIRHRVAVLGVTHFSKGTGGRDPVERITGSLAFGAVPRVVMVAAKARDGGGRILARAKSNIGPDEGGFAYDIVERGLPEDASIAATAVHWGPAIQGSAREVLAEAEADDAAGGSGGDQSALTEARAFLRDALAGGAVPVGEVRRLAAAAGLSWATIRRAKSDAGVTVAKEGMAGGWTWRLLT